MTCETFELQLEALLDEDLSEAEATALVAHASVCERCADELALSRRVLATLRETVPASCPDEVLAAVQLRDFRSTGGSRGPTIPSRIARRRSFALAASLVLIPALTFVALRLFPASPQYSPDEIAEARVQIELAFALVGEAGRDAGMYLHREVFPRHVLLPIGENLSPPPTQTD